jgi:hypothetical protein
LAAKRTFKVDSPVTKANTNGKLTEEQIFEGNVITSLGVLFGICILEGIVVGASVCPLQSVNTLIKVINDNTRLHARLPGASSMHSMIGRRFHCSKWAFEICFLQCYSRQKIKQKRARFGFVLSASLFTAEPPAVTRLSRTSLSCGLSDRLESQGFLSIEGKRRNPFPLL